MLWKVCIGCQSCMEAYMNMYPHMYVCVYIYIYITCVYIYTHTRMYIYIYIDGRVCVYIMYKSTSRSGCPMVPVSEANENPGLTIQESVRSGPKFRGFQMVWYVWIHHIYIIICIACMCIYIYTQCISLFILRMHQCAKEAEQNLDETSRKADGLTHKWEAPETQEMVHSTGWL